LHVAHVDGNEAVLFGELPRDPIEKLAREVDVVKRDPRNTELQAEALRQLAFADVAAFDEDLAELLSGGALDGQRVVQLLLRDGLRRDEELADAQTRHSRIVRAMASPSPNR